MASFGLPRWSAFGPLRAVEFPASAEAPVVVCLHGYGADAQDLAPLAQELRLSRPVRWIFPDAPHRIDPFDPGRMWFPLDQEALASAQLEGKPVDVSGLRPDGFDDAVKGVFALVESLKTPWSRIILGGFSQGSMVALETALEAPESPAGVFLLSGTLLDEASLRKKAPARAGMPFFQSHGTADPLLSFQAAERLGDILRGAGLKGSLRAFEGGHAIPPETLLELQRFLEEASAPV